MKKRISSFLLVLILLITIIPLTAQAAPSLSNFGKVYTYNGQFTDVPSGEWFAEYVQAAYEYDLINGKSSTSYEPDSNLTLAEAVKLAACLHSIYYTSMTNFDSSSAPWYQTYLDYALGNGILESGYSDYDANALRSDFALIFARALPEEALTEINDIRDGDIPDVKESYSYGDEVYALYRAGILTGNDSEGTFAPSDNIKRSEVAAIVVRMANASYRRLVTLGGGENALSASEVFAKCSPAVFYIEIYNSAGTATSFGSGFFISSSGIAVTNHHVIENAYSAKIKTSTGAVYDVAGFYDYSEDDDLALLKINGGNFSYLEMGDSDTVMTGDTVYAIGNPLGLDNTISEGIISSAARVINGETYIQTTAAISAGSSGGALINTQGEVIGVTSMTAVDGQNINLAVPINKVDTLSMGSVNSFPISSSSGPSGTTYYPGHYPVPDYGTYTGAPLYTSGTVSNGEAYYYTYRIDQITVSPDAAVNGYLDLLEANGFRYYDSFITDDGYTILIYEHNGYNLTVLFGMEVLNGISCILLMIY